MPSNNNSSNIDLDDAKSPLSTTSIDDQNQIQSHEQGDQQGLRNNSISLNAVSESPKPDIENYYPEDLSSKRTSIVEPINKKPLNNNNNNDNNNNNILGIDRSSKKSMTKDEVIKQLQDLIEDEFSFEIILKQRELFTIENEISKCEAHIIALRNHYSIKPTDHLINEPNELTENYAKLLTQFDDIRKELDEAKKLEEQRQSMPSFSSSFTFGGGNSNPYLDDITNNNKNNNNFIHSSTDSSYRTRSQTSSLRPAKYAQQCIYKRSDGIYVKITCANCQRSNFSSCQGFLNHARIAHGKEYTSQDNAALTCGEVLPDEEQDFDGMESLKIMRLEGIDPNRNLTRNQIIGGKSIYSNPNGFISNKSSIVSTAATTTTTTSDSTQSINNDSNNSTPPIGKSTSDKTNNKSVSFEKRKSISNNNNNNGNSSNLLSITPIIRKTDHLKAKVDSIKSNQNLSNEFQDLVTDVTTKVDKSHLFEGEEESNNSLLSELEMNLNKTNGTTIGRNNPSTRGLASTSKDIKIEDENAISDDTTTTTTTTTTNETDEFREKVKKTQNILLEAKKLNLNVDEYLKLALQKRRASESIDDETNDSTSTTIISNKRQKGGNGGYGGGRRKSRSNMGLRRSSNSIPS